MDLSFFLNTAATGAVIIGVIFGLIQLRHYHLSRKMDSALFLLKSYQTGEFSQGVWMILSLPDGLSKKEIEERLGEEIKMVYLVMSAWESIGILVFHREVMMDMVDDAFSDMITCSWQKLELYVSGMREEHQVDTIFEWFQWLTERMKDRQNHRSPVPAYIAHKEWIEK